MKNILLTGGSGHLGKELQKLRLYIAPSHEEMDLLKREQVLEYVIKTKPDLIVHAAAYTDVRKPENSAMEAMKCFHTNVIGTRCIMQAAEASADRMKRPVPVIYISSETVLEPYNFYAITKLQGEREVQQYAPYTIIRTAFQHNPFKEEQAPTDMLTIADSVNVIAGLIDKAIDMPCMNKTIYVGTGVKTMFDLAQRTRPDVEPVTRGHIGIGLPAMTSLLNI